MANSFTFIFVSLGAKFEVYASVNPIAASDQSHNELVGYFVSIEPLGDGGIQDLKMRPRGDIEEEEGKRRRRARFYRFIHHICPVEKNLEHFEEQSRGSRYLNSGGIRCMVSICQPSCMNKLQLHNEHQRAVSRPQQRNPPVRNDDLVPFPSLPAIFFTEQVQALNRHLFTAAAFAYPRPDKVLIARKGRGSEKE